MAAAGDDAGDGADVAEIAAKGDGDVFLGRLDIVGGVEIPPAQVRGARNADVYRVRITDFGNRDETAQQQARQHQFIDTVNEAGGIAFMARGAEDAAVLLSAVNCHSSL